MKRFNKLAIFLTILAGSILLFGGCAEKKVEVGDFLCNLESDNDEFVVLVELTETGKEKEEIIVPEYLGGKFVSSVGKSLGKGGLGFTRENLKALYIQCNPEFNKLGHCPNLERMVWMKADVRDEVLDNIIRREESFREATKLYVCSAKNLMNCEEKKYIRYANVSYIFNYEGAENEGIYWVDNFNYGGKIEYIPENPTREGYIFGGWYKEEICENRWEFERDTLPEAQYDEEKKELYQETRLYAKWYKN